VVALTCALPAIAAAEGAAPAADAATVEAVWVDRELTFTYMPLTTYYSCEGLRGKILWILRELGARPGFEVTTRGCVEVQGPELFPGVEVVAAFPAPATPEVLAQVAEHAAKRQLAARAAGQPDPVAEATKHFPARTRRIEFRSERSTAVPGLQDGDCELIEQLLRQDAFGRLGVAVVDARVNCVPRQVTLGAVRMTLETLEPVAPQ
jgi:hypothetical protein